MNDEEAEKERLLAEEQLGEEAAAAVAAANGATPAAAPVKARTPRVRYANKTDRIKARQGANLGNFLVLEIADADLERDVLKAKRDETLAVIDAMSVKMKNRASLLLDFLSGNTAKPNEILKRALDVLAADGKITTGDNGNLHKNLIAKPYSPSAARAVGRNTVAVTEKTKMIVAGAVKGELDQGDENNSWTIVAAYEHGLSTLYHIKEPPVEPVKNANCYDALARPITPT